MVIALGPAVLAGCSNEIRPSGALPWKRPGQHATDRGAGDDMTASLPRSADAPMLRLRPSPQITAEQVLADPERFAAQASIWLEGSQVGAQVSWDLEQANKTKDQKLFAQRKAIEDLKAELRTKEGVIAARDAIVERLAEQNKELTDADLPDRPLTVADLRDGDQSLISDLPPVGQQPLYGAGQLGNSWHTKPSTARSMYSRLADRARAKIGRDILIRDPGIYGRLE